MPAGRVLIALADGPLVAAPTWTRYDNLTDCRCAGYDIQRGRQSELDVTDTGTATVYFRDRNRVVDDVDLVGRQIVLQCWNPVASEWVPQFRGHVDAITYEVDPSGVKSEVQFQCVDIFAYLAGVRILVNGTMGDTRPAGLVGSAFYEDGPVATGTNDPDDGGRIEHLMFDAKVSTDMYVAFSGNILVNETLYDSSDNILSALRDAADAEFPGVANLYVDKRGGTDGTGGRVAFHGRLARFDPDGTAAGASAGAWDFTRWDAASGADVTGGVAQIRAFSYSYPRSRVINAYVAWPRADENGDEFDQANVEALERTDGASIIALGYHGRSAPDLIIKAHKTNGNTGAQECGLFGDYYVGNYSTVRRNVETVTFKAMRPDDARASATWAAMLGMDISDIVNLTIGEAGVAGEDYYVEGIRMEVRPLNPTHDYVEVTPNLSPAAYYPADNVFGA